MPTTDQQALRLSLRARLGVIALSATVTFAGGMQMSSLMAGAEDSSSTDGQEIIVAAGADRYPSASAEDWVTHADYVVVATVTQQDVIEPSQTEIERGEGLLLRELTMSVDSVAWSSQVASTPPPESFKWTALGWQFTTDPNYEEQAMTGHGEPRLEMNNTYIMAIERPNRECVSSQSTEWRGLGSGAVLPFEGSQIGHGEFEGSTQPANQTQIQWNRNGAEFAAQVAGGHLSTLEEELSTAIPDMVARSAADQEKCSR